MDNGQEEIKDYFKYQVERHLMAVSKSMFYLLEDLLKQGCHFDYKHYRKRILDITNDSKREIQEIVDKKLNISLKERYEDESENK
jgi:hypothetical protein